MSVPIKERLLVDLKPYAFRLEALAGEGLRPYPSGLYLKHCLEPVFVPGKVYYRRKRDDAHSLMPCVIYTIQDVTTDIFDELGKRLISVNEISDLSETPHLPIYGIRMCIEEVTRIIDERAPWLNLGHAQMKDLWEDFLLDGFFENGQYVRQYVGNEDYITPLYESLAGLRKQVRDFLGDDPWIMHLIKPMVSDLLIEKSIDFRIQDWTERMKNKDWS